MRVRKFILGGVMVMLLVGPTGCGGSSSNKTVLGGKNNADLILSDKDPFYDPKSLELKLNQEVSFTVYNDGKEVHNITIPGFTIDMDVAPKQTITVKLPAVSTAPRDGFYIMYCKYHQAQGEATRINIAK